MSHINSVNPHFNDIHPNPQALSPSKGDKVHKISIPPGPDPTQSRASFISFQQLKRKYLSPSFRLFEKLILRRDYNSQLHKAYQEKNIKNFLHYLDAAVDIPLLESKIGKTLMHVAVEMDSSILMQRCFSRGIPCHKEDKDGKTPLDIALEKAIKEDDYQEHIPLLLLEKSPEGAVDDKIRQKLQLHYHTNQIVNQKDIDRFKKKKKLLLKLFQVAYPKGTIKELLYQEHMPYPSLASQYLLMAVTVSHVAIIEYLIKAGVSPNLEIDSEGNTLLHYAFLLHSQNKQRDNKHLQTLLIENNGDFHKKNRFGNTPLE